MSRERFKRSAVASSRGSYVRKSHFLLIQEELSARGFEEDLADIIEISITVKVKPVYGVKCFGKIIAISEDMANKLGPDLVIRL